MTTPNVNRARIEMLDKKTDTLRDDLTTLESDFNNYDPTVYDESFPDTVPPQPTNVRASGLFREIQVMWAYNSASYIASYEVYASQTQGFTPTSTDLIWRGKDSGYNHEASLGETWYFRVCAVNTHGTASEYSAEVSASTTKVIDVEIDSEYTSGVVEQSNQYTNERETAIMNDVATKADGIYAYDSILLSNRKFIKSDTAPDTTDKFWFDTVTQLMKMWDSATSTWIEADTLTLEEHSVNTDESGTTLKSSSTDMDVRMGDVVSRLDTNEANISINATDISNRVTNTTYNDGIMQTGRWEKSYIVSASTPETLVDHLDEPLDDQYTYEFTAKTTSDTTTDTMAIARFKSNSVSGGGGSGWTLQKVSEKGTTTDHPEFFLDTTGLPSIRLYEDTSMYNVVITGERFFGTDTIAEKLEVRVSNAETSITQNADAILLKASQSDLDTTNKSLSTAESNIEINADNIALRVEKDGVISSINQTSEVITIEASKINFSGDLEVIEGVTRLRDAVVDSIHIKDGAIVDRLFAQDVITNHINAGTATIDWAKIGDVSVTSAQISSLSADKLTSGTINADNIDVTNLRVHNLKLVGGNVAEGNIASGLITSGTVASTVATDGAKQIGSSYLTFGNGNSSNNNVEGEYLELDLGSSYRIGQSKLYFYASGTRHYWYKIKYSVDGVTWHYAVGSPQDNGWVTSVSSAPFDTGETCPTTNTFQFPIVARYIRLYANGSTSNNGNHIYEWELFSTPETVIDASHLKAGTLQGVNIIQSSIDGKITIDNDGLTLFDASSNKLVYMGIDTSSTDTLGYMEFHGVDANYGSFLGGLIGVDTRGFLNIMDSTKSSFLTFYNDGVIQTQSLYTVGSVRVGHYDTELINDSATRLQINTSYGYTRVGAGNSSYSHFYTDRPAYYFDKTINIDGNLVAYRGAMNMYTNTGSGKHMVFDAYGSGTSGTEPTFRPSTDAYGYLGHTDFEWYRIYGRQIYQSASLVSSDRKHKKNITPAHGIFNSKKDGVAKRALDVLDDFSIYQYERQKEDSRIDEKPHKQIGMMLDEAPEELTAYDEQGEGFIDLYSMVSMLTQAIKELKDDMRTNNGMLK